MENVRRAYIHITCMAGLQAVAWAVIALLRGLLLGQARAASPDTALQIAIILVALPLFLAHWLWAQRLAGRDPEERGAILRRLYLYGAMASFLGPLLANALDLLDTLLQHALRPGIYSPQALWQFSLFAHPLAALAVLAALWLYHRAVLRQDLRAVGEEGGAATVRRLYGYAWSAAGLALVVLAVSALLRWLFAQAGPPAVLPQAAPLGEVARLAVGLPVWLIFWLQAQRQFARGDEAERASVERKAYLYLMVLITVLATVSTLTALLADGLGRIMGAEGAGGGDLPNVLSILVVAGALWAYHAAVLRRDMALAGEPSAAVWVRQVYHYLVAAVGLGALLAGVAGALTLLIRTLAGNPFVPEMGAWFTALILAGLPVWALPWRRAQLAATAPGPAGDAESQALARRIYLYLFLLLATLTALGSGVYVAYRLVSLALGVPPEARLPFDLAQAAVYTAMAAGVWLYHGAVLRADGRRARALRADAWAALRVAVLAPGDEALQQALQEGLRRALPGLELWAPEPGAPEVASALAQADLIVCPWTVLLSEDALGRALAASPAPKWLLPAHREGWHWLGQSEFSTAEAVRQAVRAARRVAAGEQLTPGRRPASGLTILVALVTLGLLACVLGSLAPLLLRL